MEIILFLAGLFALYWLYKGYLWVSYKNKYPIFSSSLPGGLLEVGDTVVLGSTEYEFMGINTKTGDLLYVFMPDNSVTTVAYNKRYVMEKIDSVYGKYGIKWQKV